MVTRISSTGAAFGWRAGQLAGTEAISLLRLVVLAKLLAPDAFGLVAVAAVTISLFLGVSNVGMIQALVQRSSPSLDEYDAAWTVGLVRAAIVTGALVLLGPAIAALYGEMDAGPVVQVMGLRPLVIAAGSIGVARLTRTLAFRRLAFLALPASLADAGTAIVLAPALGVWSLVTGSLVGALVQTVLSYALAPHRPRIVRNLRAAQSLVQYGQWILFAGIVALVATWLSQVALSRALGAAALGRYYVASKLAFLPSEAAAAVIGAVAFPLYASYRGDATRSAATFDSLLAGHVILVFPVSAIIIALAPELEAALGARWTGAAPATQILTAASMVGLFSEAVTWLLMGHGRADRAFVLQAVQSGARLLLIWPLIRLLGVAGAALAWFGGNVAYLVVSIVYARDILHTGLGRGAKMRISAGIIAAVAGAVTASAVGAVIDGFPALVLGGTIGALAVGGALWLLDRSKALRLVELFPWNPSWGPHAVRLSTGANTEFPDA